MTNPITRTPKLHRAIVTLGSLECRMMQQIGDRGPQTSPDLMAHLSIPRKPFVDLYKRARLKGMN